MQASEQRIKSRILAGLEANVRSFAEHGNVRVVAYAPLEAKGERAYCVLRGKGVNHPMRNETLYFATLANGTALRIEPVPEIADCPHLMADLIALVKRADEPLEKAVD